MPVAARAWRQHPHPGAAFATLSDNISITPAIEGRLERIRQRHAELLEQLSGDAMSK